MNEPIVRALKDQIDCILPCPHLQLCLFYTVLPNKDYRHVLVPLNEINKFDASQLRSLLSNRLGIYPPHHLDWIKSPKESKKDQLLSNSVNLSIDQVLGSLKRQWHFLSAESPTAEFGQALSASNSLDMSYLTMNPSDIASKISCMFDKSQEQLKDLTIEQVGISEELTVLATKISKISVAVGKLHSDPSFSESSSTNSLKLSTDDKSNYVSQPDSIRLKYYSNLKIVLKKLEKSSNSKDEVLRLLRKLKSILSSRNASTVFLFDYLIADFEGFNEKHVSFAMPISTPPSISRSSSNPSLIHQNGNSIIQKSNFNNDQKEEPGNIKKKHSRRSSRDFSFKEIRDQFMTKKDKNRDFVEPINTSSSSLPQKEVNFHPDVGTKSKFDSSNDNSEDGCHSSSSSPSLNIANYAVENHQIYSQYLMFMRPLLTKVAILAHQEFLIEWTLDTFNLVNQRITTRPEDEYWKDIHKQVVGIQNHLIQLNNLPNFLIEKSAFLAHLYRLSQQLININDVQKQVKKGFNLKTITDPLKSLAETLKTNFDVYSTANNCQTSRNNNSYDHENHYLAKHIGRRISFANQSKMVDEVLRSISQLDCNLDPSITSINKQLDYLNSHMLELLSKIVVREQERVFRVPKQFGTNVKFLNLKDDLVEPLLDWAVFEVPYVPIKSVPSIFYNKNVNKHENQQQIIKQVFLMILFILSTFAAVNHLSIILYDQEKYSGRPETRNNFAIFWKVFLNLFSSLNFFGIPLYLLTLAACIYGLFAKKNLIGGESIKVENEKQALEKSNLDFSYVLICKHRKDQSTLKKKQRTLEKILSSIMFK